MAKMPTKKAGTRKPARSDPDHVVEHRVDLSGRKAADLTQLHLDRTWESMMPEKGMPSKKPGRAFRDPSRERQRDTSGGK
jgi:hypothetical protein